MPTSEPAQNDDSLLFLLLPYFIMLCIGLSFVVLGYVRSKLIFQIQFLPNNQFKDPEWSQQHLLKCHLKVYLKPTWSLHEVYFNLTCSLTWSLLNAYLKPTLSLLKKLYAHLIHNWCIVDTYWMHTWKIPLKPLTTLDLNLLDGRMELGSLVELLSQIKTFFHFKKSSIIN